MLKEYELKVLNILRVAQDLVYENAQRGKEDRSDGALCEMVGELCKLAVNHLETKS